MAGVALGGQRVEAWLGWGPGARARAASGEGGIVRESVVAGGAGCGKSLVLVSAGLQLGKGQVVWP